MWSVSQFLLIFSPLLCIVFRRHKLAKESSGICIDHRYIYTRLFVWWILCKSIRFEKTKSELVYIERVNFANQKMAFELLLVPLYLKSENTHKCFSSGHHCQLSSSSPHHPFHFLCIKY